MMPETIPEYFFKTSSQYKDRVALKYKKNGQFSESITWSQWSHFVRSTAVALRSLGIQKGDRIGILSENSPYWTIADLGGLTTGAIIVPIYPTLSASDLAFIVRDSSIKVLFVSSLEQLEKVTLMSDFPKEVQVVCFFDNVPKPHLCFHELISSVDAVEVDAVLEQYQKVVSADDIATFIYTSGTTGVPKGVMLTHQNFIQNYLGASRRIQVTEKDVALSFLPLSHVFERLAGYYFMAFSGAQIVYAESMLTVAEDIQQVSPTVAAAVPRFYEKVYAAIQAKLQKAGPLSRSIFNQAFKIRKKIKGLQIEKRSVPFYLSLADVFFDRLVFKKIRQGVGGRLRFFISGGAPLSKELAEFFNLAGVLILEGYGLTETSPVIAVNTETEHRFGTVGKILDNVSVKIAEDGEILTSGPCVMKGYWNNEEATSEVLEKGWFHTGDIGEIDQDGYLKITDRKKDLIVTAGGKKVAPQKLEALAMRDTLFSQVVALGDKRPYIIALVVLNRAIAQEKADQLGISQAPYDEWLKSSDFFHWVEKRFQEQLKDVARFESVKKIVILPTEFSIANGELTPTLKVKRRYVMEKHAAAIEQLYAC